MRTITPKQLLDDCPECGGSWRGASLFSIYKRACQKDNIEITDDEILEHIKNKCYLHQNQSLLMEDYTNNVYVCPHCGEKFNKAL